MGTGRICSHVTRAQLWSGVVCLCVQPHLSSACLSIAPVVPKPRENIYNLQNPTSFSVWLGLEGSRVGTCPKWQVGGRRSSRRRLTMMMMMMTMTLNLAATPIFKSRSIDKGPPRLGASQSNMTTTTDLQTLKTRNPLFQQDLFHCILDPLVAPNPSLQQLRESRSVLVSLAQSCRAFSEPCLDRLWSKLDSLEPLIRCFATVLSEERAKVG